MTEHPQSDLDALNPQEVSLGDVIDDCIDRRLAGETISDQSLINAYPHLMPELAIQLQQLSVIESGLRESAERNQVRSPRCPECGTAASTDERVFEANGGTCPSCGNRVRQVGEGVSEFVGERIGRYEILHGLGEGAFGTVWCARDVQLDRLVAVKIPHKHWMATAQIDQLKREARTVAQLNHPHIVGVHEIAEDDHGTVLLVTDFVQGQSLTEWLKAGRPTPRAAAVLCAKIADALEHAHRRGVVHRDLKPSNIMVDANGEPHLLDFGLARREGDELIVSMDGKLLGTPAYMSPEQARGTSSHTDARSDVYALGVMLYEVLTGERPFRGSTRIVLHQILFEDALELRKLSSAVPEDLETICLKCLEKPKDRRYQSARDLADDLRRFASGESVHARPITRVARMGRWCKRNPLPAALVAVIAASLVLGVTATTILWRQALHESRIAGQARQEAVNEARLRRQELYISDISKIHDAWESGSVEVALSLLRRYIPHENENDDLRGFEWFYLWKLCQPILSAKTIQREPNFSIFAMAVSPDGQYLAATGGPGTVIVWDLNTEKILYRLTGHPYIVMGVAFSPDSRWLASSGRAVESGGNGHTILWEVKTGKLIQELPSGENGVSFSTDGNLLAVCCRKDNRRGIRIWGLSDSTWIERPFLDTTNVTDRRQWAVSFSPTDNDMLASAGDDGQIILWSLESGEPIANPLGAHSDVVHSLCFSPDGRTLASASRDKLVRLWDVRERRMLRALEGHSGRITSVTFSRNGKILATAGHDAKAMLWDVESGKLRDTIRAHDFQLWAVCFGSDEQTLYTGSGDGIIKRWDLAERQLSRHLDVYHPGGGPIVFCGNGDCLVTTRQDSNLILRNLATGDDVATFAAPDTDVIGWEFSPDGKTAAMITQKSIEIWDVIAQRRIGRLQGGGPAAFAPNGKLLATGGPGPDTDIHIWDVNSWALVGTPLSGIGTRNPNSIAFSPDGSMLAVGGEAKTQRRFVVWDVETRKEIAAPQGHLGAVDSIAFAQDGTICCTGSFDGRIRLWNVATWEEQEGIGRRHVSRVNSVAFSTDCRTIASGSRDGTVKLWHVASGAHLLTLEGHKASVEFVGFAPDGLTLASRGQDGTILFWRAAARESL